MNTSLSTRNLNKRKLTDSPSHGSLVIVAKRWRDRINGNTYHSAKIIINGRILFDTEFAYGGSEAYLESAATWLESDGYISLTKHKNGSREPLWRYCEERGIAFSHIAIDVANKRDL